MMKLSHVVQGELIGAPVDVVDARNKSLVGIKGIILDETKYTFIIGNGIKKRVMKQGAVFQIRLQGKLYEVTGSMLIGRSEERLKKDVKL